MRDRIQCGEWGRLVRRVATLRGFLVTAPAIQSTISQTGQITGNLSQQQVDDLVDVLNAGALPAPLVKVGERLPNVGE